MVFEKECERVGIDPEAGSSDQPAADINAVTGQIEPFTP